MELQGITSLLRKNDLLRGLAAYVVDHKQRELPSWKSELGCKKENTHDIVFYFLLELAIQKFFSPPQIVKLGQIE